jgi:hypothetical protein
MNIAIVTSGDYIYAGNVFLYAKSKGYSISFIDVLGPQNDLLLKKFKLMILFGFFRSLSLLFLSYRIKKAIKKSGNLQTIKKSNVESVLFNGNFDLIILVNYAWLFPVDDEVKIINCHPSLLPKYRGLMPISHTVNEALIHKLAYVETGVTIHQIDDNFDMGKLICQKKIELPSDTPLSEFYKKTYDLILDCLDVMVKSPEGVEKLDRGRYYSSMGFLDVVRFKFRLLKQDKFFKFIVNGGLIGLVSWFFQIAFYSFLLSNFPYIENKMMLSVYTAFVISAIISFHSLKRYVFKSEGYIYKFFIVTTLVIGIVGLLSEIIFFLVNPISPFLSTYFSYPISALIISPLSFLLKSRLVFIK